MSTNLPRPVGEWRYCPHCARPLIPDPVLGDPQGLGGYEQDWLICSCCMRPWEACPCTPASEGPCQADTSVEQSSDSEGSTGNAKDG